MMPLRVVVCGTKFGAYYLQAILNLPSLYKLVGILSKGSKQSQELANTLNVPLYTTVEDITNEQVDVACVVVKSTIVGGEGTNIAQAFLEKGIHVIQEHPVHEDDYVKLIKSAKVGNCKYHLNSFYPNVDAVHSFIQTAKTLREVSDIIYLEAACSIQVLFPMLDIIGQALGNLQSCIFEPVNDPTEHNPFYMLSGQIRDTPVTLRIFNQMDLANPESNIYLLHRVTLGTNRGTLYLPDTHGSVHWMPCMSSSLNESPILNKRIDNKFLSYPVEEIVFTAQNNSFEDHYKKVWPKSVERSLLTFYEDIWNRSYFNQTTQYYLTACKLWNDIGRKIGPSHKVYIREREPLRMKDIKEDEEWVW
ncbi:Gfo/Idh/MocA family oxidoreductase [Lysinibacillus sp. CTST325]